MIATAARLGSDLSSAELARAQQAREAELAVMLGALLRRWVEGDAEGFLVREAEKNSALSAARLHTLGASTPPNRLPLAKAARPAARPVPPPTVARACRPLPTPPLRRCLLPLPLLQESMTAEAASLVLCSYGDVMLLAIGRAYRAQADIALGNVPQAAGAAVRAKGRSIKSQASPGASSQPASQPAGKGRARLGRPPLAG